MSRQRRVLRSGIAPRKAAPAAPPPARPPQRAAAPAAAALSSELERERGARPLRQVALGAGSGFPSAANTRAAGAAAATTRSTGAGVPGPAGKREELEAEAPLRLHTLQPRRAGLATAAVSASVPRWRLQKLPQFILVETKNRGAPAGGFSSRGNPDPGGAKERAQPLPGKQLLGICLGNWLARGE